MEAYGGRAPETFSDPVPDMVKQFVVYLYRHIRYRIADQIVWFEVTPCAPDHCKRNAAHRSCLNCLVLQRAQRQRDLLYVRCVFRQAEREILQNHQLAPCAHDC